jgi:hypothetical protein
MKTSPNRRTPNTATGLAPSQQTMPTPIPDDPFLISSFTTTKPGLSSQSTSNSTAASKRSPGTPCPHTLATTTRSKTHSLRRAGGCGRRQRIDPYRRLIDRTARKSCRLRPLVPQDRFGVTSRPGPTDLHGVNRLTIEGARFGGGPHRARREKRQTVDRQRCIAPESRVSAPACSLSGGPQHARRQRNHLHQVAALSS